MHPVNKFLAQFRMGELPECGIREHVPFDEYLSWPCISASLLKHASKSAAHALATLTEPDEPSDAMRFGTFAHAGLLEPLAITQRYVVMPDLTEGITLANGGAPEKPKATKEYRQRVADWTAANQGKEIVDQESYDALVAMNDQLMRHARAVEYLNGFGPVECCIVWDDPTTGVRCKARADKLLPKLRRIVDYKTTADLAAFQRAIINLQYDLQGAFYRDGLETATGESWEFAIVAQESRRPHCVNAAPLSAANMACGHRKMRDAMARICQAVARNHWPGPADPEQWERPAWAMPDDDSESIGVWLKHSNPQLETAHA